MNKLLEKLFYLNAWTVGYRYLTDEGDELPDTEHKKKYKIIPLKDSVYYADPFVVENRQDGKIYLFVESMNRYRGKATISVSEYRDGCFGRFTEILKEDFHLSYPNVFCYHGDYYMIPESSEAKQVRLYKAESFPDNWSLCSVLLDNERPYSDNAIEIMDNKVYLYTYYETAGKGITEYYEVDFNSLTLREAETKSSIQNERPAGNPFLIGDKAYRPTQDCSEYYGKAINIYLHEKNKDEALTDYLTGDNYSISVKGITGTHTLNRSSHIEVIDIKFNRFCLTKRWIWLIKHFQTGHK